MAQFHIRMMKTCSQSSPEAGVYTWDGVTSVNLNISMVRYLRRHLVCTTDCLHEHEWWI